MLQHRKSHSKGRYYSINAFARHSVTTITVMVGVIIIILTMVVIIVIIIIIIIIVIIEWMVERVRL